MLRVTFERELKRLQEEVLSLGSEVAENLIKSIDALQRRDMRLSQQMIKADAWVNDKRIKTGLDCLTVIATQQPTAGDMRFVASIIEIVGELERIHDYVKGIGKVSLLLGNVEIREEFAVVFPRMAEKTRDMLHQALDAFTNSDADLARQIPASDDEVDDLYNEIYTKVIHLAASDPESVEYANRLQWVGHNLERAADRVINICEWIVYMVTGTYTEMDSEIDIPEIL